METSDLDSWWSSLTTERKNRIASKVMGRAVGYPECTEVWQGLPEERKQAIHEHCTDKHGYFIDPWSEGKTFSY